MSFKEPIDVRWLSDGRRMMTLTPLSYSQGDYHTTIPARTIFDGASIPRIFWRLIGSPFTGRYRGPALPHDFFYETGSVSRKEADRMFLADMKDSGVSLWKRQTIYWVVRVVGWVPWNNYRRQEDEQRPQAKIA